MTIEMIKKRKQIKEANKKGPVKCLLTTALLKWRLGAWRIKVLPLLAASPKIEIMPPLLAQQRTPAMSPYTKGKKQAPITLENISGEKRKKNLEQQQQQILERGVGGGGEENGWKNLMGGQNLAQRKTECASESHFATFIKQKTADLRRLRCP